METREGGQQARRVAWRLSRGSKEERPRERSRLAVPSFVLVYVVYPWRAPRAQSKLVCIFVFSPGARTGLQIFLNVNADDMDP